MSDARKGHSVSEKTRMKISKAQKGKHLSEETREKMSEAKKGERHPNYGKHHSEETRLKMSEAHKGILKSEDHRMKISGALKGEKNPNWKGGVLRPYYGPDWNHQRELVQQRDKGICYICHIKEDGRKHDIHHIIPFKVYGIERYKEANRLENLMTLCHTCHMTSPKVFTFNRYEKLKRLSSRRTRHPTLSVGLFVG